MAWAVPFQKGLSSWKLSTPTGRAPAMATLCEGEITKRWISHREEVIKKKALEIPENRLPLSVVQGSPSGLRPPVNP